MSLTPATVRQDLRCGAGYISHTKRCRIGTGSGTGGPKAPPETGNRTRAALLTGAAVLGGAALYANRGQVSWAAKQGINNAVSVAIGRRLRPEIKISKKAFEHTKASSKSEVLKHEEKQSWESARRAIGKATKQRDLKSATKAAGFTARAAAKTERNMARRMRLATEYHRRKMEPGYRKPPRRKRTDFWADGFDFPSAEG